MDHGPRDFSPEPKARRKMRVCRVGLELQYGVAEHPKTPVNASVTEDRSENGEMFVVGAQNPLAFFAYITRDGVLLCRQIWRSMTQV